jgi:peptidoglycan/xylan/chitin deacetylase (PgdA/CDA1 family)
MHVTILMYHMITTPEAPIESRLCRTPDAFRQDMEQIHQAGYHVLPLSMVLDGIAGKVDLPEKAVAITFDDGIADVYENALPILQEFNYPSSVFIVSGCVNGYNDWGMVFGLPRKRMLKSSEIRAMSEAGVDIGAHTVNHAWLGKSDKTVATREIRDSKAALEDILGKTVSTFAYPFGNWNQTARNAVIEAGYLGACSTMPGRNKKDTDRYLLHRTEIKGADAPWQFRLKLRFATTDMPPKPPLRRILRKILPGRNNSST